MRKLAMGLLAIFLVTACAGCDLDDFAEKIPNTNQTSLQSSSNSTVPSKTTSSSNATNIQSSSESIVSQGERKSKDEVKKIALDRAGLKEEQIRNYSIELDFDDDRAVWEYEIEFISGATEYEFEINAIDGTIIKFDKEGTLD